MANANIIPPKLCPFKNKYEGGDYIKEKVAGCKHDDFLAHWKQAIEGWPGFTVPGVKLWHLKYK